MLSCQGALGVSLEHPQGLAMMGRGNSRREGAPELSPVRKQNSSV